MLTHWTRIYIGWHVATSNIVTASHGIYDEVSGCIITFHVYLREYIARRVFPAYIHLGIRSYTCSYQYCSITIRSMRSYCNTTIYM